MALNYTTLSATTERNVIPKLIDNVFDSNVVMKRLRKKGTKLGGGTDIQYPIIMASNSAGGAYQPESTLSTTPNEIIDNAKYDWRFYYANISIFRHEELKNMGKSQIINLLKAKTQVAEKTLSDTLGTDIFGSNTSGYALDGLGIITAVSTTDCGGLDSGDISTWAPARDTTSTVMSISALQGLYGDLTIENESPSVIITTQDNFDRYYNILSSMHRFVDVKTADGGYQSLTFNGKPILVDSHCTADAVFMLNEKYLDLVIHRDENFRFEPFIKPVNQNVKVAKIYFAGNLVTSQRRMQGVATAIAA